MSDVKRLTVFWSVELLRLVKSVAASEGVSTSEFLAHLVDEHLLARPPAPRVRRRTATKPPRRKRS